MNFMILTTRYFVIGLFSLLWAVCQGCSSPTVMSESQDDAFGKMMAIQECYQQYSHQYQKGPSSIDDLMPLLTEAGHDTDELLKSTQDGSLLVVWDFKISQTQSTEPIVLGYEANSQQGSRIVMTSMGVYAMLDEEFYSAPLPPGHQAPAKPAN